MKISTTILDLLIDHLDGQRVPIIAHHRGRQLTTAACLARGLIRYDEPAVRRTTVITEVGRGTLAKELADLADTLARAGLDLANPSPEIPGRLAELRKWATGRRFLASQDYSHI